MFESRLNQDQSVKKTGKRRFSIDDVSSDSSLLGYCSRWLRCRTQRGRGRGRHRQWYQRHWWCESSCQIQARGGDGGSAATTRGKATILETAREEPGACLDRAKSEHAKSTAAFQSTAALQRGSSSSQWGMESRETNNELFAQCRGRGRASRNDGGGHVPLE
jgi:hypothetical protein